MYISVDDGSSYKEIALYDREIFSWVPFDEVECKLKFQN